MADCAEPITEREFRRPWDVHPDPADGDLRHRLGYENYVMRRRALEWLAVALPDVSQRCREQQAELAIQRFWQSTPSFADVCRVRNARAEWEANQEWAAGNRERNGMTKVEWEMLEEHFAGANDPVAQSILAKARAALSDIHHQPEEQP